MLYLILFIPFRAKPRPSKKARLDKAAEEDAVLELGETPDLEVAIPEDIPNDPPQQDNNLIAEERPIDTSSPVNQPTSSIRIEKSTGPTKPTDKPTAPVQTGDTKDDEVVITGISHTEPSNPVTLSKHSAMEEFAAFGKGKWNADLATYASLNAQDIHSGYLNRLYTSRDYEAGLVNMMKDKYEVTSICSSCLYISILVDAPSPRGPVCNLLSNRDLLI